MPLPVDASLEFQYSIVYSMTCVIALRQGSIKSVRKNRRDPVVQRPPFPYMYYFIVRQDDFFKSFVAKLLNVAQLRSKGCVLFELRVACFLG